MPSTDLVADMYNLTHELLTDNGFDHYEISNYGKPESHSKHNSMYWEGDREYLAFGCGAASHLDSMRFSRPKTLKGFYRYVEGLSNGTFVDDTKRETLADKASIVLMCGMRR